MFQDKYVFTQFASFLNRSKFNRIVAKYVKHFTCWNQLLALMFGQPSNRESLRDLETLHNACIAWLRRTVNEMVHNTTRLQVTGVQLGRRKSGQFLPYDN